LFRQLNAALDWRDALAICAKRRQAPRPLKRGGLAGRQNGRQDAQSLIGGAIIANQHDFSAAGRRQNGEAIVNSMDLGIKRVDLVYTIVDRGKGEDVVNLLRESGVTFNLISVGYGASGLGLVDFLGFTDLERDIVLSVVTRDRSRMILDRLLYKFDLNEADRGIAFVMPISGVCGSLALRYISGTTNGGAEKNGNFGGQLAATEAEMQDMKDLEFNLILTVVNRGFADTVIEATREAGARGGTIFYARGTGIHELEKFFAISIQPEKEVVMTLAKKGSTQAIMQRIVQAAGLQTVGRGLSIALPVSEVAGITEFKEFKPE
jgi:hypothetical protein